MALLTALLGGWTIFLLLALWASCFATLWHFKNREMPRHVSRPIEEMTILRPIRGLNDGMREALESLADPKFNRQLEILIAIESEKDPAYPVALGFALSKRGRDISIILTGPSKSRMGKIHNMIEALPKAKRPFVIFSDADTWANPALIEETSRAFQEGYDAVFALPYFSESRNVAELSFAIALNHGFSTPAALSYYALDFPFCSGAWMGFSKKAIQDIGGLEPLAHQIADDYALSMAILKNGKKHLFLNQPVFFRETTQSVKDTFRHLSKWAAIIHSCLPKVYSFALVCSPIHVALIFLAFSLTTGRATSFASGLVYMVIFSRMLIGLIQDLRISGRAMPLYAYLGIPLFDLAATFIWLSGFRSQIEWRNKRYRLSPGGHSEVINNSAMTELAN
jgi:ceramide glucosyltransferase